MNNIKKTILLLVAAALIVPSTYGMEEKVVRCWRPEFETEHWIKEDKVVAGMFYFMQGGNEEKFNLLFKEFCKNPKKHNLRAVLVIEFSPCRREPEGKGNTITHKIIPDFLIKLRHYYWSPKDLTSLEEEAQKRCANKRIEENLEKYIFKILEFALQNPDTCSWLNDFGENFLHSISKKILHRSEAYALEIILNFLNEKRLLKKLLEMKNKKEEDPLFLAVKNVNSVVVETFLKFEANPNTYSLKCNGPEMGHFTILHMALNKLNSYINDEAKRKSLLKIIEILLEKKANPNAMGPMSCDKYCKSFGTPAHIAAQVNNKEALKLLEKYHANFQIKTHIIEPGRYYSTGDTIDEIIEDRMRREEQRRRQEEERQRREMARNLESQIVSLNEDDLTEEEARKIMEILQKKFGKK